MIELPADAPDAVAREDTEVRKELDRRIPQKELGGNLLLCTWNIRGLDRMTAAWTAGPNETPKRDRRSIHAVAAIIRRFDLIIIQEVRESRDALRFLMEEVLGEEWSVIVLEPDRTLLGNDETTAIVFDTRRVMPSGLIDRLTLPEAPGQAPGSSDGGEPFVIRPYAAFFRTRLTPTTFGLVALRAAYSKPSAMASRLAGWMTWLRGWASSLMASGDSLLMLGDFGSDRSGDPLYQALVNGGISIPVELSGVPRTIFEEAAASSFVDHVAWISDPDGNPLMSLGYQGRAGYFPFVRDHSAETRVRLAWRISDHYPLWVEFTTPPPWDPLLP
jgi:hypothetical protein